MHKLGFVYEGTMKECEIKDGKWIDLEIYALLDKGRENPKIDD